jgi:hypothetical protein
MRDRWIIVAALAVIAGSVFITWKRVESPRSEPAADGALAQGPEILRYVALPPEPEPLLETAPDGAVYQLVEAGHFARWLRAEAAQHRASTSAWQDS